jgi:hypothetical protein
MSPTRLSDQRRAAIQTIDEAKALFDSIAQSEIKIARANAMTEARIAAIKEQNTAKVAMIDPDLDAKREALSEFIETHKELFSKPRHVSTDFGRFGLQSATKLDLFDKVACLDFVVDQGMANCFEVAYKPVAKGIQAALESGTKVPGCKLLSGDIAHYTVAKALLDEAKASGS